MGRRITRLTVLHTGKLFAAFYALISLIMLPFMLFAVLASDGKSVVPMLGMLIVYPIIGFIGGVVAAVLYNIAAKWVGGLEFSVEAVEPE